ncbi:MAG: DUF1697 domain-containing protein [Chloroflexaceae bacterium]|jgi:uncharacterized protein (DUF1697 family)|nr:DUF1697 domain-containing protein [Chloroflexaceae bacterium]
MTQTSFIALLRGINVGGHNKVPMAELRLLCESLGWHHVQTYIQSGNVLFQSDETAVSLESALEAAITQRFGLAISVLVRTAAEWQALMHGNPFPAASAHEPNMVMLALSKQPPAPGAAEGLRQRATNGEHITQVGEALWIHYQQGVAGSKLSPALFDRLVGSPVTARNWRTVVTLHELAQANQ